MELVFVLLAVILLVILPVAVLLLVAGGLVYAIGRAFGGGKREGTAASATGMRAGQDRAAEPVEARGDSPNRNKGA